MSGAVSAQYGVPCPTCNVAAYQACRTRGSRRVTDTHAARIEAQFDREDALRQIAPDTYTAEDF